MESMENGTPLNPNVSFGFYYRQETEEEQQQISAMNRQVLFEQNTELEQYTSHQQPFNFYQDISSSNSNTSSVTMDASLSYETISVDSPPSDDYNQIQGSPVSSDFSSVSSPRLTSSPCSVSSTSSSGGIYSSGALQKKKGMPYIPSYMDLSNGPEPCVVCSDAATGYHYKCMTCEGCKGFFRRTIQKNLIYQCKWSGSCIVDKSTRNNCQECRFKKCTSAGMAIELVLNDRQRIAKRKLIEENREKRKLDNRNQLKYNGDYMTNEDRAMVTTIVHAYEDTSRKITNKDNINCVELDNRIPNVKMWQQLSLVITPSIQKVIEFAKQVPGFSKLFLEDQILLLKSCCVELMCLRVACRYNPEDETVHLNNGTAISGDQLNANSEAGILTNSIFNFAVNLSKLQLDETEIALLAAVLLMQSDRAGLKDPEHVEKFQDAILGAYKRYIAEKRPSQPVHWAKILMKVTDLRTISTRHADRALSTKVDNPDELPSLLFDMFSEFGGTAITTMDINAEFT